MQIEYKNCDIQFDHEGRSFVKPARAAEAAKKVLDRLRAPCNVKIIPTLRMEKGEEKLKFTAIFFCFRDESDISIVAHSGFTVYR